MTNIEPLGGLVLVKEFKQEETKSASGLIITASSKETELNRGQIIKMGPGERDTGGVIHPLPLNIGDIIIYNGMHATEITDSSGEKFKFISWRNLFGTENNG